MLLSIGEVAKLMGISVRTLRYYDAIGLLRPSAVTPAGYRSYDEKAMETLQQILFFRELGFPWARLERFSGIRNMTNGRRSNGAGSFCSWNGPGWMRFCRLWRTHWREEQ